MFSDDPHVNETVTTWGLSQSNFPDMVVAEGRMPFGSATP